MLNQTKKRDPSEQTDCLASEGRRSSVVEPASTYSAACFAIQRSSSNRSEMQSKADHNDNSRVKTAGERHPCRSTQHAPDYKEAATQLCLRTVSLALCVPLQELSASSRCKAEIALARQVAMYLAHTQFSLAMTDIGIAMGRDRTTISHACNLVEDRRDDQDFDLMVTQLEDLLSQAVLAIEATRFEYGMALGQEDGSHD